MAKHLHQLDIDAYDSLVFLVNISLHNFVYSDDLDSDAHWHYKDCEAQVAFQGNNFYFL